MAKMRDGTIMAVVLTVGLVVLLIKVLLWFSAITSV